MGAREVDVPHEVQSAAEIRRKSDVGWRATCSEFWASSPRLKSKLLQFVEALNLCIISPVYRQVWGKMNKAPSFTPRDIPSPTTSTRQGSSRPSTYAPSIADSTTSPPSTTTTASSLPWRTRTGPWSARSHVPPAGASPMPGTGQHRLVIGIDYGTTFTGELPRFISHY
jgi:hypothetical protein